MTTGAGAAAPVLTRCAGDPRRRSQVAGPHIYGAGRRSQVAGLFFSGLVGIFWYYLGEQYRSITEVIK